ncbi:hypothetical protein OIE66_40565 [Nonomuraea sp. NBC_01738]|uniref:hypothetical protein n=1 Tax=Nonomuraea sp. NBC_01738 TaxID=2976003 RepID=UPI002E1054A3|nr:hypothetical protein OIE66_40565 [Nonomuraea sp. NBC_01738]
MPYQCPTPGCTRPRPGHLTTCRACMSGLLRDLADAPSLETHLELAYTRQVRFGDRHGSRPTDERALPYNDRPRAPLEQLRATITSWQRALTVDAARPGPTCRTACEHPSCGWIHRTRPPADGLRGEVVWLLRQQRAMLAHPALVEIITDVRDACRAARRIIDRPPDLWYAGPCNILGCTADLYARHGELTIRCRECGGTHSALLREQWLMKQVGDQLGTATEIARALAGFHPDLTPSRIWGYAHRGRLLPKGRDASGHPLYAFGDVRRLLDS